MSGFDQGFSPNSDESNNKATFSTADFISRAQSACAAGNLALGMHLYLAAFERSQSSNVPEEDAINGLKQAWALACQLRERSMAEYIFEKLEPYLSNGEVEGCAEQLQRLAFDRLQEFGLSQEDLEDMADMLANDVLGGLGAHVVKVEHLGGIRVSGGRDAGESHDGGEPTLEMSDPIEIVEAAAGIIAAADEARLKEGNALDDSDEVSAENQDSGANALPMQPVADPSDSAQEPADGADDASMADDAAKAGAPESVEGPQISQSEAFEKLAKAVKEIGERKSARPDRITYADLPGFGTVVATMRSLGIGLQNDAEFSRLAKLLNDRHGIERRPTTDSLVFHSFAREDASRFMVATAGELGLPVMRMHMEEGLRGMPMLCVSSPADNTPRLNASKTAILGPAVVIIEDIDLWVPPTNEPGEGLEAFLANQANQGARQAVALVRSAVESPHAYVLASAGDINAIDPFFCDMLDPASIVEIALPTPEERVDIWMAVSRDHPSMRGVPLADLVRLSNNMPRFDIFMAVREAIDQAYKEGLATRSYVPVTRDNIFDKLAAYQPLDSREYHELEEAVIADFRRGLGNLSSLLSGDEG